MTDRKNHWESIYTDKDAHQVGWYQESPDISLKLLDEIMATNEKSLLDIGAGASSLADELIKKGFKDIGLLDISESAFRVVKQRLGENSSIPEYYVADITEFELDRQYDIWHDRAVFHFLTDTNDRSKYVTCMDKLLSANGRAIIGSFSLNGPTKCSGLDIVQYDRNKMSVELGDRFEIINTCTDIHVTPGGVNQEFMYFIIKRSV